jgi:PIN like domain
VQAVAVPSSAIGREPLPVTNPNILDTSWIPQVAALGWLIITCDSMISQNRMEITTVREDTVKVVASTSGDAEENGGTSKYA